MPKRHAYRAVPIPVDKSRKVARSVAMSTSEKLTVDGVLRLLLGEGFEQASNDRAWLVSLLRRQGFDADGDLGGDFAYLSDDDVDQFLSEAQNFEHSWWAPDALWPAMAGAPPPAMPPSGPPPWPSAGPPPGAWPGAPAAWPGPPWQSTPPAYWQPQAHWQPQPYWQPQAYWQPQPAGPPFSAMPRPCASPPGTWPGPPPPAAYWQPLPAEPPWGCSAPRPTTTSSHRPPDRLSVASGPAARHVPLARGGSPASLRLRNALPPLLPRLVAGLRASRRRLVRPDTLAAFLQFVLFGDKDITLDAVAHSSLQAAVRQYASFLGCGGENRSQFRSLFGLDRDISAQTRFDQTDASRNMQTLTTRIGHVLGFAAKSRATWAFKSLRIYATSLPAEYYRLPDHLDREEGFKSVHKDLHEAVVVGGVESYFASKFIHVRENREHFSSDPKAIEALLRKGVSASDNTSASSARNGVDRTASAARFLGCSIDTLKKTIEQLPRDVKEKQPPDSIVSNYEKTKVTRQRSEKAFEDLRGAVAAAFVNNKGMPFKTQQQYDDAIRERFKANLAADAVFEDVGWIPWLFCAKKAKRDGGSVLLWQLARFGKCIIRGCDRATGDVIPELARQIVGTRTDFDPTSIFGIGGNGVPNNPHDRKVRNALIELEMIWFLLGWKADGSNQFLEYLAFTLDPRDGWGRLNPLPHWLGVAWYDYHCRGDSELMPIYNGFVKTKLNLGASLQTTASCLCCRLGKIFRDATNPMDTPEVKAIKKVRLKKEYIPLLTGDASAAEVHGASFVDIHLWGPRLKATSWAIISSARLAGECEETLKLRQRLLFARLLIDLAHGGRPIESDDMKIESSIFVPLGTDGQCIGMDENTGLPEFLLLHIKGVVETGKTTKTIWEWKRINLNPKNRAFCCGSLLVYLFLTFFLPHNIVEGLVFADYELALDGTVKTPEKAWSDEQYLGRVRDLFRAAGYTGDLVNRRTFRSTAAAHCLRACWYHTNKYDILKDHLGHDPDTSTFLRYIANVSHYVAQVFGASGDPLLDPNTEFPFKSSRHGSAEQWPEEHRVPLIKWLGDHVRAGTVRDVWKVAL